MADVLYFLPFFLGVCFFMLGRQFKDPFLAILGGMILFGTGVGIVINPLEDIDSLTNIFLASAFWASGGYISIRSAIESLKG